MQLRLQYMSILRFYRGMPRDDESAVSPARSKAVSPPPEPVAADGPSPNGQKDLVGSGATALLGIYHVVLGVILIYLTAVIWPPDFKVAAKTVGLSENEKDVETTIVFFERSASPQPKRSDLQPPSPTPGSTRAPDNTTDKAPTGGPPNEPTTSEGTAAY